MPGRPPALPGWIRRRLPVDVLGDLEEGFRRRREGGRSRLTATAWYLFEVVRFLVRLQAVPVGPRHTRSGPGDRLGQDLRFAIRSLTRRPTTTLVITATLALAIGANTTIFGLVNSLFFRTLAVESPERIIEIYGSSERDGSAGGFQGFLPLSHPNFEDVRDRASMLEGAYAYTFFPVSVEFGAEGERNNAMFVSASYFDLLGVTPQLGRGFAPGEDETAGSAPYAVISHALWQEKFGGAQSAVGSRFRLNGRGYSVVGIAPEGFRGTSTTLGTDLWVPMSMIVDLPVWGPLWENRGARFFFVGARLAEGRSAAEAQAELEAVWAGLREEHPRVNGRAGIQSIALLEARVNPNFRSVLAGASAVLLTVVSVLLLIACLNVANLLLARSLERTREMAIRSSLGAGRTRLMMQLLTESVVLFGLGGAAGLAVAAWGAAALTGVQPPALFGATLDVALDLRVLLFTAGVTMGCGLLFGFVPAWQVTRREVADQLRGGERGGDSAGGHRIRSVLVGSQVGLSLIALVGAGLFLRALSRANDVPLGFEPEGLALLSIDPGAQGYSEEEGRVYWRQALEVVGAVPGVRSVAIASQRPLSFAPLRSILRADEDPEDPQAGSMVRESVVSVGYVETAGASLIQGRAFSSADAQGGASVGIVNRRLAETFWPGEDPVGQRFRIRLPPTEITVVGVVETGKHVAISEDPAPAYFRPAEQSYPPAATLFVRLESGSAGVVEQARRALQALDPAMPVFDIMPATQLVRLATWNTRAVSLLLAAFGLVGMLLAAVGVYGVVATTVRRRTREIGLRIALGAGSHETILVVVRSTLLTTAAGLAAGLLAASVLARPLTPQLYGISPVDAATYGVTGATLAVIAVVAAYVPARRATRVSPTEALRAD